MTTIRTDSPLTSALLGLDQPSTGPSTLPVGDAAPTGDLPATSVVPTTGETSTDPRLPVDADVQSASRQRAAADPFASFVQHALLGELAPGLASDAAEAPLFAAANDLVNQIFVGLANAAVQGSEADMMAAMGELGLPHGGMQDPATRQALAQLKGEMGFPPTESLDLDALLALLMKSAEHDRAAAPPPRAASGGAPSSGGASGASSSSGGNAPRPSSSGGASTAPSSTAPSSSTGTTPSGTAPSTTTPSSPTSSTSGTARVDAKSWTPGPGDVTPAQLRKIVPSLSAQKAAEVAPHLNVAMREANISTPERKAAFIAQLAHESGGFKYNEEIASGKAYEGRRDLGNVKPGDGVKFKGRGYIQLTGRANYEAAGKALGLDLVNNPGLAAKPENASRVAAWYWNSRGLNKLADQGRFDEITRRINGGYNGKADRDAYHRRAQGAGLPDGLPTTGQVASGPSTTAPSTTTPAPTTTSPSSTAPSSTSGVRATNSVAPSSMSEAEKYAHYKKIIEAQGGRVNETPGQRNLLGLRKETSTKANGGQGIYDDTMVMLWKDSQGNPRVREYKANTEPSGRYEDRMGQDANGDGRLDQGRLRAGYYEFAPSTYRGGNALRMIGDSQVDRDTNHDGKFNDGKTTSGGASMLFHVGGNNMTGSAGCQTMPPAEFNRFWRDLTAGGRVSKVGYTVVHAS